MEPCAGPVVSHRDVGAGGARSGWRQHCGLHRAAEQGGGGGRGGQAWEKLRGCLALAVTVQKSIYLDQGDGQNREKWSDERF